MTSDNPRPINILNIGPAKQPAKAISGNPSFEMAVLDTKSPSELPHANTYIRKY